MVQSFVIEETKELLYDNDKLQEWTEKCKALGLEKQLALTEKDKSPIPFNVMNEVSKRVYQTLCPAIVTYKDYGKTAIPLEVLGLIMLSENEGYFKEIQIWYDDKNPDPLAVGVLELGLYQKEYYLIARWGDVLRDFADLKLDAIKRYTSSSIIQLSRKISEAKTQLENIEANTNAYFDCQVESYQVIGF